MNDLILETFTHIILFTCSTLANILSAISGGGAGFIQFPILILLGLPFMPALGTHKASTLLLGLGSLMRKGTIYDLNFKIAFILVAVGIPGCILGTYLVSLIDEKKAELGLGILTIAMAIYSFISKSMDHKAAQRKISLSSFLAGILAIFFAAILSGSLSSGAGLFATMFMITFFGLDIKRAISYSVIFIGSLWNFVGAATVYQISYIQWDWVPTLLLASFTGGYLGARLLKYLSPRTVRYIFAAVSLVSGIILIHSSLELI